MVSQNAGQLGAHDKTGDGQVKLYKPVHHKPPSGRGYEGADPWSSTPLHAPYEPSWPVSAKLTKRYDVPYN